MILTQIILTPFSQGTSITWGPGSVILILCETAMFVICKTNIPGQITYHILVNTEVMWLYWSCVNGHLCDLGLF